MPDEKDPKDLPVNPELQIVPHEKKGPGKESVEKERQIIRTIFEGGDDVELPWVQPSKKETGQA